MAKSYLESLLSENEKILRVARQHWFILVSTIILEIVLILVILVLATLGRIFDYGDIQILTASELGVNLFRRIEDPIKFKTAMLNAKERLERGEFDLKNRGEDIPPLLANLEQLRQQGVLTEEEFQRKKAELLAKM